MSPKYTYNPYLSFLLSAIIAWNSFGYIGFMLGNAMFDELHHHDDECEIVFCYCEVGEGERICTCHHQTEKTSHHPEQNAHYDCFLDLDINDVAHDNTLLKWDSRIFLIYSGIQLQSNYGQLTYPISYSAHPLNGYLSALERPPSVV